MRLDSIPEFASNSMCIPLNPGSIPLPGGF